MQAFIDGKGIEMKRPRGWVDCSEPNWDWSFYDYRIKTKQHYVPFTYEDAEEFRYIKDIELEGEANIIWEIAFWNKSEIVLRSMYNKQRTRVLTYDYLFEKAKYNSGLEYPERRAIYKPFGKLVKE